MSSRALLSRFNAKLLIMRVRTQGATLSTERERLLHYPGKIISFVKLSRFAAGKETAEISIHRDFVNQAAITVLI